MPAVRGLTWSRLRLPRTRRMVNYCVQAPAGRCSSPVTSSGSGRSRLCQSPPWRSGQRPLARKRTPCSYQPTAATPSLASNQCDEQVDPSPAPSSRTRRRSVSIPLSSVSHVSCGVIAPWCRRESLCLEVALPGQPPGASPRVDVVRHGDQQRLAAPLRVVEDEVVVRRRVARRRRRSSPSSCGASGLALRRLRRAAAADRSTACRCGRARCRA